MVAAGLGVTILADIVYRPWPLEGSRIQVREVIEPVPSLDVGAAWRRGKPLSNAARHFANFSRLLVESYQPIGPCN
jgi:DNA-binding transcriptional LysR family regulator